MLGIAHTARQSCSSSTSPTRSSPTTSPGRLWPSRRPRPFFPAGTVHLAVVDPGRRDRAARRWRWSRASRSSWGPTTGCSPRFSGATRGAPSTWRPPEYRLPRREPHVPRPRRVRARRRPPGAGASTPRGWGRRSPIRSGWSWPEVREVTGSVAGAVVHTDRFGNLITSIHARLGGARSDARRDDPGRRARGAAGRHLRDLQPGRPGALVGSGGRLRDRGARGERRGAAARPARGTPVVVSRTSSMPVRPRRRR